ncbi:MAG: MarR family winged helix-turn-helix transcriptional regulator [Anaerolineae bacterium]
MKGPPPEVASRVNKAEAIGRAVKEMAGDVSLAGVELFRRIQLAAHLHDTLLEGPLRDADVSGARWSLLLRLYLDEVVDSGRGTSPTQLSHTQRVSKNTISALLRGLEKQGLIERTLDQTDRRSFRIRLSPAGREFVREATPVHLARLNELATGLTPDELQQLTELLDKLTHSLFERAWASGQCHAPWRRGPTDRR